MRPRARFAPAAAILALAALLLGPDPRAAAEPSRAPDRATLRNEDVVRMLVAGRSPADVVAAIRSAEPAFDLSDEMKQELGLAGVPAEVLAAMAERQAEADRARAPAPPGDTAPEAPAGGKAPIVVTVRSDSSRGGEKGILFPPGLDDRTARALQLGTSAEERAVTDIAVFLACRTADHVPDQWRSKSPLGRDFVSVARHEMLDFKPGATQVPGPKALAGLGVPVPRGESGGPGQKWLSLRLPVELRGEVAPGISHDLVVGVAILAGERFLQVAEARRDGVVPGADGLFLSLVVSEEEREGKVTLELRFEEVGAAGAPPR